MDDLASGVFLQRRAVCHIPPELTKRRDGPAQPTGAKISRVKLAFDFRPVNVHTITLFIPALFWPHAGIDHDSPIAPVLQVLLSRGDRAEERGDNEQAWMCQRFGVPRQTDWPIAPIAACGAGMLPGNDFWLRADPVHLQVNRDQLILLAPEALSVDDIEAAALCAALDRHFSTDGFVFFAPEPNRWYLKAHRPVRIRTCSLSRAVGRDIDPLLPTGEDRMAWHRIFNEVQMVLHANPVNEERSQRGALPINSLWFSGGGTLPDARSTFRAVFGSSSLARGLSQLSGIPFSPLAQFTPDISATDVLIELCDAQTASMCLDPAAWKKALERLEQVWFVPIAQLLRTRRIRKIVIATVDDDRALQWSVKRTNLWRWWRSSTSPPCPGARN